MSWHLISDDNKCRRWKNDDGRQYSVGGEIPLSRVLEAAKKRGKNEEIAILNELIAEGY